jgi:hypothetical protein
MFKESFRAACYEASVHVLTFLLSFCVVGFAAIGLYRAAPLLSPQHMLGIAIIASIAALVVAFVLFHANYSIYAAYGAGFGGIALLYAALYFAYSVYHLLAPATLFWSLTAVALIAGYVAVRFHGRLLALVAVAMGILTPALVLPTSRLFLSWYFIIFLLVTMLVSYYRRWFELVVSAFLGYLVYNSFLFGQTSLEGTGNLLTIYQVLYHMIAFFSIFTIIPWLYCLYSPKERIFEPICFAIGGAYTAAMMHYAIGAQVTIVAQLPFFVRFFVGKAAPLMNDVYMYMFGIYSGIYIALFVLLLLIRRQAKIALGALISLLIVCIVGAVYTHAKSTGLLPTVIRAANLVKKVIQ